jgi:hypothetical protein
MRKKISIGSGARAVMLLCCALPTLAQAPFKPAEVTSATDITYPIQSIADGVVVIDVSIRKARSQQAASCAKFRL